MIAIREVGMVTSVGRDAKTTLTSILCGIARPKELPYFTLADPEQQEPEGVIGHPIEALTEGFHLYGAWLRMARKCLQNLIDRAGPEVARGAASWQSTALLIVTPDTRGARFMSEGDESPDALREPFVDRVAAWLGVPPAMAHALPVGRTGVFQALEHAANLLLHHGTERVVVLAVDSLLDTLTLEWLSASHRLKSGGVPAGLMPGECAAALLLERPTAAGLAVTVRAAASEFPGPDEQRTSAERGARLARVLGRCLAGGQAATPERLLVSDQNGEQWRAEEFGFCGLQAGDGWPARESVVLPALSVGDTGAASSALACCVGALALRSGLVRARESVVLGSSFNGRAGAALLAAG